MHTKKILFSLAVATFFSGCTLIEQDRAGIQIKTENAATVSINGENKGPAPVTIEDLKPGEYSIKLDGDEGSWEKSVRIENGTLFYINYALAPTDELQEGEMIYLERGRGVGVISTPGQAEVTLDGEKQGFTPYLIQNITEGEHEIILTKDGYKSRAIKINGVKDHKIMVEAKLKSLSATEPTPTPEVAASPSASGSASPTAKGSATPRGSASASPSGSARASATPSGRASATPRASGSTSNANVKGTITVLETSTGWLRVRDKAGLEGKEITTINTGETFDYIEQTDNGWTQIVLKDGQVGFVASRFIKVNN